jgi:hypothetical protein
MINEKNQQEVIDNLKAIASAAQNCLDALYSDQFSVKEAEVSMNYIRLCTQKVQYFIRFPEEIT